jgi:hypothetical protein
VSKPEIKVPNVDEFVARCRDFDERKKSDPLYKMYGVASFLVQNAWGDPAGMANGVSVLLVTWNWTFFNKYGRYNFDHLTACIAGNLRTLAAYLHRDISTFADVDEPYVTNLFVKFLEALRSDAKEASGPESPIAVGKTLHILCPHFFPLWDRETALQYVGDYTDQSASKYLAFCKTAREILTGLKQYKAFTDLVAESKKPPLKLFDEYNYSKYTKSWNV